MFLSESVRGRIPFYLSRPDHDKIEIHWCHIEDTKGRRELILVKSCIYPNDTSFRASTIPATRYARPALESNRKQNMLQSLSNCARNTGAARLNTGKCSCLVLSKCTVEVDAQG